MLSVKLIAERSDSSDSHGPVVPSRDTLSAATGARSTRERMLPPVLPLHACLPHPQYPILKTDVMMLLAPACLTPSMRIDLVQTTTLKDQVMTPTAQSFTASATCTHFEAA